jgi:hypothetical protein
MNETPRVRATPTRGLTAAVRAFLKDRESASVQEVVDGIAQTAPGARRSSVRHALQNERYFGRVDRGRYKAL